MSGKFGQKAQGGRLWLAVVLGVVLLCVSCSPATVAFRQGRKAEEQKDYDTAVINYQKALQIQPNNPRFLIYEHEARTKASLVHYAKGKQLLAENRPSEAAGEFQKAVSIDPSNQAAAEELQRILLQESAAKRQRENEIRRAMERGQQTETAGAAELKPLSTEPIVHLHISADSRRVFETLAKLAGLNVVFYYNFQPRPVSLDLTNVTIGDALQAAAVEAGVFWKPITPNTILVVTDSPSNRREMELEVMKTVYLQNPLSPTDRTAILTAVKQVVGIQKAYDNPETNSIIIYGTPDKVATAEKLIHSLDRGKAEVLIDVTVLEADKDRLRDLGLSPVPLSGNTLMAFGFNPPGSSSSTTGSNGQTTPTTPTLQLNRLGKLTTGDFSVALPGVIANALLTDNQTHILQNPQLRVTAGEDAKLRIGQRVPFATGSFGVPTAGVLGGGTSAFGLLANTQFQYQDVGVNLDITPFVAANGDIILKAKIDISSVGTPVNIGGVEEPTFTQRTVEHTIRLKEGEVSLLGGLIQSQTNRVVSGLPGLADVPFLKYFFSDQSYEVKDEEVLIMLNPRIVRLPDDLEAERWNPPPSPPPAEGSKPAAPGQQPQGVRR
jgi:general secretion pathway protein D